MDTRNSISATIISCLALSQLLGAQEKPLIRGWVLDSETLAPIPGAFVAPVGSGTGVLSDSLGAFLLGVEPAPTHTLRVTQLGYSELQAELTAEAVSTPITLRLSPNPIEIEGLTVLVERLEERRRGPFGVAQVLDRTQLLEAPGGSGYDLVLRTIPFVDLCGPGSEALCLAGRTMMGGRREVQVCLDDNKVRPELMETALAGVDPRALYLVEVYSRAGEVRMYTPGYIKRLIATGGSLSPLSFGCRGGFDA